MKNKKQHWIPQSYLQSWCDPATPEKQEPYVWVFDQDGNSSRRKSPENIFYEPDLYTINLNDGTRDLVIEHGLAGLETAFSKVRKETLLKRKKLTIEDKIIIFAFCSAMFERTPSHRDHLKKEWGRILSKMASIKEQFQRASLEQREAITSIGRLTNGPSYSMDEVMKFQANPIQQLLLPAVHAQTRLMIPMNLSILCTNSNPGFITSDNPCVWYDPEASKRPFPYKNPGIGFKTIEITLPISPNRILLLSWNSYEPYIEVNERVVDILNQRTLAFCNEYFVVNQNLKRSEWFH